MWNLSGHSVEFHHLSGKACGAIARSHVEHLGHDTHVEGFKSSGGSLYLRLRHAVGRIFFIKAAAEHRHRQCHGKYMF